MVRTNQGGSIISFIVIGAVLAALLVGGVYFLNQHQQSTSTPSAQSPRSDQSNQPRPESEKEESQALAPDTSSQHATTQLPSTGAKETLGTLLSVGLISGVSISYVRSRRSHLSL